jgi:hypothetical protein
MKPVLVAAEAGTPLAASRGAFHWHRTGRVIVDASYKGKPEARSQPLP